MDYFMQPYHGGMLLLFIDEISDMQLLEVGYSMPDPIESPVPLYRDSFCLHFVLEGSCEFNGQPACAGQAFLMPPLTPNRLVTHPGYKHTWIMFKGSVAQTYLHYTQISLNGQSFDYTRFSLQPEVDRLLRLLEQPDCSSLFVSKSILLSIFAKCALPRNHSQSSDYVTLADKFLEKHFTEVVSSSDVAHSIGISQKHLCRIYKQKTGKTIQQTLLCLRLETAKSLLSRTDYSIHEIASILGFSDPLYFSRFIKKMTGQSPTLLRQSLIQWRDT